MLHWRAPGPTHGRRKHGNNVSARSGIRGSAVPNEGTVAAERFDLRSDYISRPTEAMVEAMVAASSETPGIGFREDPVVSRLEALCADLLGKEDALFCPTCTLCNQIAVNAFCRPGDILLTPSKAHVLTSEGGAAAALSGAQAETVETERGAMLPAALAAALAPEPGGGRPRVGLVLVENTHLRAGGCAVSAENMGTVAELAAAHGVPVHLDGARLFNAAAFLGVEVADLTRDADTVALSLNKGLSAPVGAVLAGAADLIAEAVDIRQRFGGGWRPAGIPAAAGIVALEQMTGCMAADNENARLLARGLAGIRAGTGIGVESRANGGGCKATRLVPVIAVRRCARHQFGSCVPWKGTILQRVKIPPGNCRSSR